MSRFQRDSRVTVVGGEGWALGARGTVLSSLGDDSHLVLLDEPRLDGAGDGPFSAVQFATTDLILTAGEIQPDRPGLEALYRQAAAAVASHGHFRNEQVALRSLLEGALKGGLASEALSLLVDYRDRVLALYPDKTTSGWGAALESYGYSLYQVGLRFGDQRVTEEAVAVLNEALRFSSLVDRMGQVQRFYFLGLALNVLGGARAEPILYERAVAVLEAALDFKYESYMRQLIVTLGQAHLGLGRLKGDPSHADAALEILARVSMTRKDGGLTWAHQQVAVAEAHLMSHQRTASTLIAARKAANGALGFYKSRQNEYWFMPGWVEHALAVQERIRGAAPL